MPGRLELIKERRGYAPAKGAAQPKVAAFTEGQSPSSNQTAQPTPRGSIWLRLGRAAEIRRGHGGFRRGTPRVRFALVTLVQRSPFTV
jgi:hypothetical protein